MACVPPLRLGRDRTRNPVDEDAHGHGIWSVAYGRTSFCLAAPDSEKEYTSVQYLVNPAGTKVVPPVW